MNEEKRKHSGIDLGLSEILSRLEATPPVAPTAPDPIAPPPPAAPSRDESVYERLAIEEQWARLLSLCERELAGGGERSVEATLWWARAAMKTRTIPVALLSAPVDAVTREPLPEESRHLTSVAAITLIELGAALESQKEPEMALTFAERAAKLDPTHGARHQEMVNAEIHRQKGLSNLSSRQREDRDRRVEKLEQEHAESRRQSKDSAVATASVGALSAIPDLSVYMKRIQEARAEANAGKVTAVADALVKKPRKISSLVAACGVTALGVAAAFFVVTQQEPELAPGIKTVSLVLDSRQRAPVLPNTTAMSAFDGLFYDLQSKDERSRGAGSVVPAAVQVPAQNAPEASEARKNPPSAAPSVPESRASRQKDTVNTVGPIESEQIRQALSGAQGSDDDDKAEILFGPRAGGRSGDSRGGDFVQGSSPEAPATGSFALDRFPEKRPYRIVADTRILGEPSFRTTVLGELSVGDRVMADAQVESWLQIRSLNGRTGFILAQDARPAD